MNGKELSKWWFDKDNVEEFVDTIFRCLEQRYRKALEVEEPIVLMDKGYDFYETRIKATLLTLGVDENKILELINQAKIKYNIQGSMEYLKLIITSDKRPKKKEEKEFADSKEDDEIYDHYLEKNIELLNESLADSRDGDFAKIEFIDGDPEEMHDQIIETIGDEIKNATQYERYPEILESAKQSFGNNLKSICIAGSAGKGNFIKGWSDIDVYVIVEHFDGEQFSKFSDKMMKENVHLGITCYTQKEIETDNISNRARMMFYELNQGKYNVLYKDDNFTVPKYSLKQIQNNDKNEYASTIHNLRRLLYSQDATNRTSVNSNTDDITKIIKNVILLEKIIIRDKTGTTTSGYYDTSTEFAKYISSKLGNNEEEKEIIESISLTDYIKQIKTRDDESIRNNIIQYAKNILKIADLLIESDKQQGNKVNQSNSPNKEEIDYEL